MIENNDTRRPNRKSQFDKTEHRFLMTCKRDCREVDIALGEPDETPVTGKIVSFGTRTVEIENSYTGKRNLIYKSAINMITPRDDEDTP